MLERRRRRVPGFLSNLTDLSVAADARACLKRLSQRPVVKEIELAAYRPVSYTHLTLPTIDRV